MGTMQRKSVAPLAAGADTAMVLATIVGMEIRAHAPWYRVQLRVLAVHFGAVVADAPSPLSTPRCAAGQAQLRLGKPLRMKCRASPVLLFMRAGKVVAGSVGIARATVPFHGEHDAPVGSRPVLSRRLSLTVARSYVGERWLLPF